MMVQPVMATPYLESFLKAGVYENPDCNGSQGWLLEIRSYPQEISANLNVPYAVNVSCAWYYQDYFWESTTITIKQGAYTCKILLDVLPRAPSGNIDVSRTNSCTTDLLTPFSLKIVTEYEPEIPFTNYEIYTTFYPRVTHN